MSVLTAQSELYLAGPNSFASQPYCLMCIVEEPFYDRSQLLFNIIFRDTFSPEQWEEGEIFL